MAGIRDGRGSNYIFFCSTPHDLRFNLLRSRSFALFYILSAPTLLSITFKKNKKNNINIFFFKFKCLKIKLFLIYKHICLKNMSCMLCMSKEQIRAPAPLHFGKSNLLPLPLCSPSLIIYFIITA